MTSDGQRRLQDQLLKLTRAAEAGDLAEFFYEDLQFHKTLWAISGNRYAARALEAMMGSLFAAGLMRAHAIDLRAEVDKHHKLVSALLAGKPHLAAEILTGIADHFKDLVVAARGDAEP